MKHIEKRTQSHQHFLDWVRSKNGELNDFIELSQTEKEAKAKELYDSFRKAGVKSLVRKELVEDQYFICCYCQKEIKQDGTTIVEHLKSRQLYPEEVLSFSNLLASCDGGDKNREQGNRENKIEAYPLHCNSSKGSDILPISPLDKLCEDFFDYDFSINPEERIIEIRGKTAEEEVEQTIKILGLNEYPIQRDRYDAVIRYIINGNPLVDDLENDLSNLKSKEELRDILNSLFDEEKGIFIPDEGNKYKPYCQIIVVVIRNLLKHPFLQI